MRVMVTGGAGFIGSALVRYLVSEIGADVLNIDKLTYAGNLASLQSVQGAANYRFLRADICDRSKLRQAFDDFKPEIVMHLAAESHVDRSISGAGDFIQTNVVGTFSLLDEAKHYWEKLESTAKSQFRFLHVSTDEVYGSLGPEGLFDEETRYDPSSPYSASKAASDHLAIAWQRTFGLPVVISNCSNNYGPYHFPEKLIPLMILNALEGKELPIYGSGLNIRDWLYVEDHVRGLFTVASRGRVGEKYNIGGRNERTNLEVVTRICKILDDVAPRENPHSDLIRHVADRPGHDARYAIDATKLEEELGWRAQESFETGVEKTVRWFVDNEAWWSPLRKQVYSGERLGILTRS